MQARMIGRLLLAVSLLLSLPLAAVRAAEGPVKTLPAHLAGSGIATEGEVALVDGWLKALAAGQQGGPAAHAWFDHWIGTALPFNFRYDGKDFTGTSDAWQFQCSDVRRQGNVEMQDWVWLHAKTGLKATWHIKRFLDYPAVDTLLTFENAGSKDTALVEQVQNLDLKVNHSQAGKSFTIHGPMAAAAAPTTSCPSRGKLPSRPASRGSAGEDSPATRSCRSSISRPRKTAACWSASAGPATGRPNSAAPGRNWRSKAGMPATHFRLHPGEQVRGPRVLLVFWNGQCLHGHNMLRRVLYEHYLPRLPGGKPHEPLVSVNTCFTYHGNGGYLEKVTEQTLSALVPPFIESGGRGLRDRRRILQLQGLADAQRTNRLLLEQGAIPPRTSPRLRKPWPRRASIFGLWFPPECLGNMGDPQGAGKRSWRSSTTMSRTRA